MPRSVLVGTALLLAATFSPRAMAQFETRTSLATTIAHPNSVVVGDFNGDGILDLAAVSSIPSGSVEILLGNGDGTFRSGSTYAVGLYPGYGVSSSLRKNGILDLVLNDGGLDNVWVMLGNGDGTFLPAVAYPTTATSYMVALGNFTGSGSLDIVATEGYSTQHVDFCNCLEVLPGNGDGTFGTPITTPLPYGLTAYSIIPGDFNDDGKLDIAAAGESFPNDYVAILLGDGNGSFNADGDYQVSASCDTLATGYFTTSKKNRLDLAVVGGLYVLLGDGNGNFGEPRPYLSTTVPIWLIAEDLDSDGNVDLAVSDGFPFPGVTVYKGNGNGTFQKGVFYHVGSDEGGNFLAAGDFNGDRKPDLVVVNEVNAIITTLLNTGVLSFAPTTPLNFKKQAVGTTSNPQTVTLTNNGSTALRIASMKASSEFAVTSTCGTSVAAGAKCTISATFSPTQKGAKQGTITIIDSASSKPMVIELLGTGT